MALIKCPECGGQISDKAPACIHCGCPASEFHVNNNSPEEVVQATNICIFRNKEQDVSCINQYYTPLSEEDKTHFKQFLELEYGISNFRPVISDEKYLQFYNELKKWSEFYYLSTHVTAKLALECIKNNFQTFEFDVLPRYNDKRVRPIPVQTINDANRVHCPRCNSTSVTTEERGYDIIWGWIGSSWKKNLCQKCGYTWTPGTK